MNDKTLDAKTVDANLRDAYEKGFHDGYDKIYKEYEQLALECQTLRSLLGRAAS